MTPLFAPRRVALATAAALSLALPLSASAQEDTIRKNLAERMPTLGKIDQVSPTPMKGLFELRLGNDLLYTDAEGNFLLQGELFDTRARQNLTEQRLEAINQIAFKDLPLQNAIAIKRGNGKRQFAVFADPRCTFCKRFERDIQKLDNVTMHVFLLPILGPESTRISQQIWCSADRAKTWTDWMLKNTVPQGSGQCDTKALDANRALAQQYRITGTPALIFENGRRVPGAITLAQTESLLNQR